MTTLSLSLADRLADLQAAYAAAISTTADEIDPDAVIAKIKRTPDALSLALAYADAVRGLAIIRARTDALEGLAGRADGLAIEAKQAPTASGSNGEFLSNRILEALKNDYRMTDAKVNEFHTAIRDACRGDREWVNPFGSERAQLESEVGELSAQIVSALTGGGEGLNPDAFALLDVLARGGELRAKLLNCRSRFEQVERAYDVMKSSYEARTAGTAAAELNRAAAGLAQRIADHLKQLRTAARAAGEDVTRARAALAAAGVNDGVIEGLTR